MLTHATSTKVQILTQKELQQKRALSEKEMALKRFVNFIDRQALKLVAYATLS